MARDYRVTGKGRGHALEKVLSKRPPRHGDVRQLVATPLVAEEAFNVHKRVKVAASLDGGGELAFVYYTLAD